MEVVHRDGYMEVFLEGRPLEEGDFITSWTFMNGSPYRTDLAINAMRVVRLNRVTMTCQAENGRNVRVRPEDLVSPHRISPEHAAEYSKHFAVLDHDCRPEPHCTCDHNAWYHRDVKPRSCGAEGCGCKSYTRCLKYRSICGTCQTSR